MDDMIKTIIDLVKSHERINPSSIQTFTVGPGVSPGRSRHLNGIRGLSPPVGDCTLP
jgi:hypothetical protein